jgi:rRNA processing protein Gar1
LNHLLLGRELKILKRLGRPLHLSSNFNLIVKLEKVPRIGETVVDENLKPVGKVLDVLGSTASPYAAIKPEIRQPQKLLNQMLYVFNSKRKKGRWK